MQTDCKRVHRGWQRVPARGGAAGCLGRATRGGAGARACARVQGRCTWAAAGAAPGGPRARAQSLLSRRRRAAVRPAAPHSATGGVDARRLRAPTAFLHPLAARQARFNLQDRLFHETLISQLFINLCAVLICFLTECLTSVD